MNAEPCSGPDLVCDGPAPQFATDLACSDAELYDLLFHYHRLHGMLVRCRAGDSATLTAVEHVLDPLEAAAMQRGIPLHRLAG